VLDYEAVVVGLGGMGSAAVAALSVRGTRVLGLEASSRGHELGASAGRSRMIRKAYFEHSDYVPLLHRAYALWRRLERASGTRLLDLTGLLVAGAASSPVLRGALASAELHGIELERLDAAALARRYPALRLRSAEIGLFEPGAGVVFPEKAIAAALGCAEAYGAELRFETPVEGYRCEPEAIVVRLAGGFEVRTARLALCAGPWTGRVCAEADLPIRVQRNVQVWFAPASAAYQRDRFPAFFVDRPELPAPLYGFPDYGDGVKAALHGFGESTAADRLDRAVREADVALIRAALDGWMPGAAGAFASGKACMYALTPDEHFILDVHPRDARIVLACGFSGHGFKFAPVVGEIVAELVRAGRTRHPIGFLRLGRFRPRERQPGVR